MQSSTSPYVHTWPCCSCMHVCVPSPKEWSWAPRHQVQERNISGLMRHQHFIRVEKGAGLSLRTVCCIALQLQLVRACDQIHASCSLPMIQGPRYQAPRRICRSLVPARSQDGSDCWNDLSTEWPNGHLGPWSRALIGGVQP
jgi:hypothetical protein